MDPLFEGFKKERFDSIHSKIEEHLEQLTRDVLYPQIVKFILNKVNESFSRNHDIRTIQTTITNKNSGIFKENDVPDTITIDELNEEVNIPVKTIIKYKLMIIDMFIADYDKYKDQLIDFEYIHDNRFYLLKKGETVNHQSQYRLSFDKYKKIPENAKKKYKEITSDTYTFMFHIRPKLDNK